MAGGEAAGAAEAALDGPGPGATRAKSPKLVTTARNVEAKPADEVLSGFHEPSTNCSVVASAIVPGPRMTTLTRADAGAVTGCPLWSTMRMR